MSYISLLKMVKERVHEYGASPKRMRSSNLVWAFMQAMGNGAYSCNLKRKPVYQNPRSEACNNSRPSSLHP